ncbi:uncharacterized protein LOC131954045 [Physella acuta]|uniref:uncharacterized protein LOC131954045 n=1 Tax=Physella acuta TaxID=109671 RepID=UPI0027DAD9B7|nr:uncharacterized protein LOC131954045 [Physella acuta]
MAIDVADPRVNTSWSSAADDTPASLHVADDTPASLHVADDTPASLQVFTMVNYVILSGTISAVGIVFNIINVIVFTKLGFTDSVNVTLLWLSVTDTMVLLLMVGYSLVHNPLLAQRFSHHDYLEAFGYLAFFWPRVVFKHISKCLTAFLAFERFLCISRPLKVKAIITHTTTCVSITAIYALNILAVVPIYACFSIGLTFDTLTNATTAGLVTSPDAPQLQNVTMTTNMFVHMTSFVLVTTFTIGLLKIFHRKSQWRHSTSSAGRNSSASSRDDKMVKLVILVSSVFVTCSFPSFVGAVAMLLAEDSALFNDVILVMFSVFFVLDSINATANIFIYINMSSRFRLTLQLMVKDVWSGSPRLK